MGAINSPPAVKTVGCPMSKATGLSQHFLVKQWFLEYQTHSQGLALIQ